MIKDLTYTLSDPMITEDQIKSRIRDLAHFIKTHFPQDCQLVFIGVLKGSFLFLSDLIRELQIPLEVDFIQTSSYGNGTKSSQSITLIKDLTLSITGKDVILIEDIIDSGNTIKKVKELLLERHPKSFLLCSLLSKPSRRESDIAIDWIGFTIPDLFIVGYGLDVAEKFRNLPYLAEAKSNQVKGD